MSDTTTGVVIVGATVLSCGVMGVVLTAAPPTTAESAALLSSGMLGVSSPLMMKPAGMALGAKGLIASGSTFKAAAVGVSAAKVGALGVSAAKVGAVALTAGAMGTLGAVVLIGVLAVGGVVLVYKVAK